MSILEEWVDNLYLHEAYKKARASLAINHTGVEMGMIDMWIRSFQNELNRLQPLIPPDDNPFDLTTLALLLKQAEEHNKNDYVIRMARTQGAAV